MQSYLKPYSDFVYFNYTIDEILAVSGKDDPAMESKRNKVREMIEKKFGYYRKRSDDMTCEGDMEYTCDFGIWRMFPNKTLGGTAQPFGQKKFTKLRAAQTFACDKGSR